VLRWIMRRGAFALTQSVKGVIDAPMVSDMLKGHAEAMSEIIRDQPIAWLGQAEEIAAEPCCGMQSGRQLRARRGASGRATPRIECSYKRPLMAGSSRQSVSVPCWELRTSSSIAVPTRVSENRCHGSRLARSLLPHLADGDNRSLQQGCQQAQKPPCERNRETCVALVQNAPRLFRR
jgi:hypothetical protein